MCAHLEGGTRGVWGNGTIGWILSFISRGGKDTDKFGSINCLSLPSGVCVDLWGYEAKFKFEKIIS